MEMELGLRIQALREGLGLTQARFAETLHVSQGAVSRWEKGRHAPREHVPGRRSPASPGSPPLNCDMVRATQRAIAPAQTAT